MKLRFWMMMALVCIGGALASELVVWCAVCRDILGRLAGHGHLVALVHQRGIYESDLENGTSKEQLIAAQNVHWLSRNESVPKAMVDRDYDLIKAQFVDENGFQSALRSNWLWPVCLRAEIEEQRRDLRSIDNKISTVVINVSDDECRQFYEAHRDAFVQPLRFRAHHIFFAAPDGYPAEVIETKRRAIEAVATDLARGADFSRLAAQFSEDEATKANGGDLNYFSSWRIMPEFFGAIAKLRVGETSEPFRSHLGFHIARLIDIKAARALSFEEARPEVVLALENEKRRRALQSLVAGLVRRAGFVRSSR